MDFLKTYLAALGGTATALIVLAFLGKSLVENWLKKSYRAWESELEKKYKEDFKRYETKIDKMATKEEIQLNYLHPERAKSAIDIFAKCVALQTKLLEFPKMDNSSLATISAHSKKVRVFIAEVVGLLADFMQHIQLQAIYFDDETNKKFNVFSRQVLQGLINRLQEDTDLAVNQLSEQIKEIETTVKAILGIAEDRKEKSLPGEM